MTIPVGATLDPVTTRQLIEAYKPFDAVDTYYQEQFLALIGKAPHHFANRYHYTPGHLTAQAIIYCGARKAVALLHHAKLGIWVGPGGHVEPIDHSLTDTAVREAREETGITTLTLASPIPFDIDIHGFPAKKDQPDHLHYDVRFLFTVPAATEIVIDADSLDCRWVEITKLRDFMPMALSNSRYVRKLEALYL
jgi:8-oxo-dGTP pyrophosphatase MutT (NUDIX family)